MKDVSFYSYTVVGTIISTGQTVSIILSVLGAGALHKKKPMKRTYAAEKNARQYYERPKTIPALYTFSPDAAHHLTNPIL